MAVGVLVATGLAGLEIHDSGAVSYYYWKYLIALELIGTVVAAVLLDAAALELPSDVEPRLGRGRRGALARTLGAAAVVLAVSQVFGSTGLPGFSPPAAQGSLSRETVEAAMLSPNPVAAPILAAASVELPPGSHGIYLASDPLTQHPVNAQQWYLALTGTWTQESNDRAGNLALADPAAVDTQATRAARVLAADPAAVLIVAEQDVAALRGLLPAADDDRVLNW